MNKTGNFSKVQRMVILAVLIALTLVMALTPLGYLKIGALSISFLCIPIAIGATVLGPTAGLILGTLFGITSFVQCFGMDTFGTAMLSINWFYTFIICVVARALMGWFTGLIAKGLGKVFEGKTVGKFNLNKLIHFSRQIKHRQRFHMCGLGKHIHNPACAEHIARRCQHRRIACQRGRIARHIHQPPRALHWR